MKYIKTAILIAGMAAATAACTRKPVVPEFSMLSIDTLIGTPANGCKIEFRFATIANAAKSPALRSIEAANAEYFFELEDFGGTARQAVDSAIRQIAAAAGVTRNTVMGVLRRIDADFAKSLNHGDPDGR